MVGERCCIRDVAVTEALTFDTSNVVKPVHYLLNLLFLFKEMVRRCPTSINLFNACLDTGYSPAPQPGKETAFNNNTSNPQSKNFYCILLLQNSPQVLLFDNKPVSTICLKCNKSVIVVDNVVGAAIDGSTVWCDGKCIIDVTGSNLFDRVDTTSDSCG
jgi:hypothetical protein